ncbi:MAG TPA: hypothetical protein VMG82_01580 [Candidatus Sulfotelmatobacter sp.]|nr:hypothetical protein [Candidatus Sulfotelmatobacter sp.]
MLHKKPAKAKEETALIATEQTFVGRRHPAVDWQQMPKRKRNWNKARPSSGANPPMQTVAQVFGGTLAGGIPIT